MAFRVVTTIGERQTSRIPTSYTQFWAVVPIAAAVELFPDCLAIRRPVSDVSPVVAFLYVSRAHRSSSVARATLMCVGFPSGAICDAWGTDNGPGIAVGVRRTTVSLQAELAPRLLEIRQGGEDESWRPRSRPCQLGQTIVVASQDGRLATKVQMSPYCSAEHPAGFSWLRAVAQLPARFRNVSPAECIHRPVPEPRSGTVTSVHATDQSARWLLTVCSTFLCRVAIGNPLLFGSCRMHLSVTERHVGACVQLFRSTLSDSPRMLQADPSTIFLTTRQIPLPSGAEISQLAAGLGAGNGGAELVDSTGGIDPPATRWRSPRLLRLYWVQAARLDTSWRLVGIVEAPNGPQQAGFFNCLQDWVEQQQAAYDDDVAAAAAAAEIVPAPATPKRRRRVSLQALV